MLIDCRLSTGMRVLLGCSVSRNLWLLSTCFLGKCLNSTSLAKPRFSVCLCVSWGGDVLHFTAHQAELWLIHKLVMVPFDRYVSSLSDLCSCRSPCVCGVTVLDMHHRHHWQIVQSCASFMCPVDWWYSGYAARWKLISSNVDLIWTCSVPFCSPVLEETKPATQGIHACREGLKPTYTQFSNPSFTEPIWTVSLLLWDFCSWNLKKQSTGQRPAMWTRRLAVKTSWPSSCMLNKIQTNEA